MPQSLYFRSRDAEKDVLWVNTLETSRVTLPLDGQSVTVRQESEFPRSGRSVLTVHAARPATFALQVRVPEWARWLKLSIDDRVVHASSGWAEIPARRWNDGDRVAIQFRLGRRLVLGQDQGNTGRAALLWGPFVLACDTQLNPDLPPLRDLGFVDLQRPLPLKSDRPLTFEVKVAVPDKDEPQSAVFVPFADAGASGSSYRVWLRAPGTVPPPAESLAIKGTPSQSRPDDRPGSIDDGDPATFAVTYDGKPARKDWFTLTFKEPVSVKQIVFVHGQCLHNGGWFDTRPGKPWVMVKRADARGIWETVGRLDDYPMTTATDNNRLQPGQAFTLRLSQGGGCHRRTCVGYPGLRR